MTEARIVLPAPAEVGQLNHQEILHTKRLRHKPIAIAMNSNFVGTFSYAISVTDRLVIKRRTQRGAHPRKTQRQTRAAENSGKIAPVP